MGAGIIAGNTISQNGSGLHIPAYALSNDIFANHFTDNFTSVHSGADGYLLGSSMPLFYRYNSHYFKILLGNRYSDYTGIDTNGDGIGEIPYSSVNYQDSHPLPDFLSTYRIYGWTLYHQGGIGKLIEDNFIIQGAVVKLRSSVHKVFAAAVAANETWIFKGGNASDKTTWSGWLTFATPPPAGHTLEVAIGVSDAGGANFEATRPVTEISGDGVDSILRFAADPLVFKLPEGDKRLTVRLTNTGASDLELMVGGAACVIFAPMRSQPPVNLPPVFLLFD